MIASLVIGLLIVTVIGSFINSYINNRRQIAFNRIDSIYDQMELYILKHKIKVDNKLVNFLKGYKAFKVNNEYADIHVLLTLLQQIPASKFEKDKAEADRFYTTLPEGMMELKRRFDREIINAIFLSIFRAEFLLFFTYCILKYVLRAMYERSGTRLVMFYRAIKDLFRYETIVVSQNQRLSYS